MKKLISLALSLILILSALSVYAVSAAADQAEPAAIAQDADLAETAEDEPVDLGRHFFSHISVTNFYRSCFSGGCDREDGNYIELEEPASDAEQLWRFQRQSDGSYTIRNVRWNKFFSVCSLKENAVAGMNDSYPAGYDRWFIYGKPTYGYRLCPKADTSLAVKVDLIGPPEDYADRYDYLTLSPNTAPCTNLSIYDCSGFTSLDKPDFRLKNTANGVEISWDPVDNATDYCVYRYNSAEKKWEEICRTMEEHWLDEDVVSNTVYKYAVRCIAPYVSGWNAKTITFYAPPRIVCTVADDGSINLSWKRVPGVSRYRIVWINGEDGTAASVGYPTGTSLTIKNPAEKYFDAVHSFAGYSITADAKKYLSDRSPEAGYTLCPTPKVSVKMNPDGYILNWNDCLYDKSAIIDGYYRVYRNCRATGYRWRSIATVPKGTESYTVKGLKNGESYRFTVRCIDSATDKPISGYLQTANYRFYLAPKVTSFKSAGSEKYTITWQKGYQAAKYRVFCWNGARWVNLGDTDKTYASVRFFHTGKHPIYAIRTIGSSGRFLSYYWESILKPEKDTIRYYYPGTYAK